MTTSTETPGRRHRCRPSRPSGCVTTARAPSAAIPADGRSCSASPTCRPTSPSRASTGRTAPSRSPSTPTVTARCSPRRGSPQRHVGRADGDGRTEAAKQTWTASELEARAADGAWPDYQDDPAERARVLRAVHDLGFAVLHGTPTAEDTVLAIAATFGYPRETNYGRLFDVRVEPDPTNLAFTGRAIAPHTDNPYRDPVPTLQLLHCLDQRLRGRRVGAGRRLQGRGHPAHRGPDAFEPADQDPGVLRLVGRPRQPPRRPPADRRRRGRPHPRDQVQQPVDAGARPRGDEASAFYDAYRGSPRSSPGPS